MWPQLSPAVRMSRFANTAIRAIENAYPIFRQPLLHVNVTAQPSAAWTLQQLREVVGLESRHRLLVAAWQCRTL